MTDFEKEMFSFLEPIVSQGGYELVDLTFKKEYGTDTMTVFVWKKGGVSHNDCEAVTALIDAPLDELNPTKDKPYNLSVSSPGLDRPIVTADDYRRNLDEEIEVFYKSPVNGKKKIEGTLKEIRENEIVLTVKNNDLVVNKELIGSARPLIKF